MINLYLRSLISSDICSLFCLEKVMHLKMQLSVGFNAAGVTVTTTNNDETQDKTTESNKGSSPVL